MLEIQERIVDLGNLKKKSEKQNNGKFIIKF